MRAAILIPRVMGTGEVLLLRRAPFLRYFPDTYSFPGGKVEGDEDDLAAALREAREETGREYTEEDVVFLCAETVDWGGVAQEVMVYRVDDEESWMPALSSEHTDYLWVKPLDALRSVSLSGPMTRRILERLAFPG